MSTLFVSISSPSANQQVGRTITVTGSIALQASAGHSLTSKSVSVQFGAGTTSKAATFTSTTAWTCTGDVGASFPPGASITISVGAHASLRYNITAGEPDVEFVDAGTSVVVVLPPPVPPSVSVDAFTAEIVTDQLPAAFTLAGAASDLDSPIASVQCALDLGGFETVENISGNWSRWQKRFTLKEGLHRFILQAIDNGGNVSGRVERFVNIRRATANTDPNTASITSWTRLEPQCFVSDLGKSVAARVFDPLWLLTRQWQLGEFQAEDTGTPVLAKVQARSHKLTRCFFGEAPQSGSIAAQPYDPLQMPLETLVERRRMRPSDPNDARMLPFAVEAGLHFLRMLDRVTLSKSYRAVLLARFALQPLTQPTDDVTQRFMQTMVGRAPDARRLAAAFRNGGALQVTLEAALGIATADRSPIEQCANEWLAWYDKMFGEPEPTARDAWNNSRLEYAVTIAARGPSGEITLTASEFDGGRLDWSSFDYNYNVFLSAPDGNSMVTTETLVPSPVSFRGAPAPRFWEIEESGITYGLLPTGANDLPQMLMAEYASTYGNDWYMVPLTLPVGTATTIDYLVVTDTFGVRSLLRPIGATAIQNEWSMWQMATRSPVGATPSFGNLGNTFFLPPTLGRSVDGTALEDVMFMRDEMANVAWAIERNIESPVEQSLPRVQATGAASAEPQATVPPAPNAAPRYLLSSTVPPNWIPLIPAQQIKDGKVISQLKVGAVLQPDGTNRIHPAQGQVLQSNPNLVIYDEEVPREGINVKRNRRMARWVDGTTWVWTSFNKQVGRGEGSSGLVFDQLLNAQDPGGGGVSST